VKVATAQLAGDSRNADRIVVTDHAVIVLDGASTSDPVDVDPGDYAQALGEHLAEQLDTEPTTPIPDAVAATIGHAVAQFHLTPGRSPSSTVSVLRARDSIADIYVLGDSPIFYGAGTDTAILLDDRIRAVSPAERATYAAALRAGRGFDDQHRRLLAELRRTERRNRNTDGGYWIAETDPAAAHHALMVRLDPRSVTWAVLATDGAADVLRHLGCDWPDIAHHDAGALAALLDHAHRWEEHTDPHARRLPRSRRHDDKTIAAVTGMWQ